jgi:hypothetical protein
MTWEVITFGVTLDHLSDVIIDLRKINGLNAKKDELPESPVSDIPRLPAGKGRHRPA